MSSKKDAAVTALAKTNEDRRLVVFKRMLMGLEKSIAAALPRHMTPERMMRVVTTAAQRNPKLFECDVTSLQKSIVEASELGLEPSGALGHAYLIPRNNRRTGKMECQLQLGFKGMIELAMRSGKVASITALVVYSCDHFVWEEGLAPKLEHRPKLDRPTSAKPVCAYAVAQMVGGQVAHVVLPIAEVEKRRAASTTPKGGPWDTHWDAMARKSAIRELAKYLPQSPELQRAAAVDEMREMGTDAIDVDYSMVDDGAPEKTTPGGTAQERVETPTGDVVIRKGESPDHVEVVDAQTGEVLTGDEAYVQQGPDGDGKEIG